MTAGAPSGDRPVVRIDRPAAPGQDEGTRPGQSSADRPATVSGHVRPDEGVGAAARRPLQLNRLVLSLLLVVAFGAGIGLSELSRQQSDRDASDRRGSELALGAVQLDRVASTSTVALRLQLQNRGPEPVRLVDVTVAGTPLRADPVEAVEPLPAGGDRIVMLVAPVGCGDQGASLTVPERLELTVDAETSRGGRRTTRVVAAAPPLLDAFSDVSRTGLDRLCGLVPPEEALKAYEIDQAYGVDGAGEGGRPEEGAPAGGNNAFRVALDNVSRVPQRLLGVDSPLGSTTVLHDGVPVTFPVTIPTDGSAAGTFPLGDAGPPEISTYPVTVRITCGSPRITGIGTPIYVSFDAGPGTPYQQTEVSGSFGRC